MNNNAVKKEIFIDLLGQYHDTKEKAEQHNHDIHLVFRNYIANELFVEFEDGRIDKLATTKNIWDMLEFTPKSIKDIYTIEMSR